MASESEVIMGSVGGITLSLLTIVDKMSTAQMGDAVRRADNIPEYKEVRLAEYRARPKEFLKFVATSEKRFEDEVMQREAMKNAEYIIRGGRH